MALCGSQECSLNRQASPTERSLRREAWRPEPACADHCDASLWPNTDVLASGRRTALGVPSALRTDGWRRVLGHQLLSHRPGRAASRAPWSAVDLARILPARTTISRRHVDVVGCLCGHRLACGGSRPRCRRNRVIRLAHFGRRNPAEDGPAQVVEPVEKCLSLLLPSVALRKHRAQRYPEHLESRGWRRVFLPA